MAAAAAATVLTISAAAAQAVQFRSEYERSGGTNVGDASQAEQLSESIQGSKVARSEILGQTSEGRPIVAFEVGPSSEPSILLMGGIHAGEVEGSIALVQFVRDVAAGKRVAAAHAWIIPYISPDGSADIGVLHRPNQNGPIEAGFRINATGLNLNRDFMKAESPEIRSLLKLVSRTQPVLVADFHTTDGAKYGLEMDGAVLPLDVGLSVPHARWSSSRAARSLNETRDKLSEDLVQMLRAQSVAGENYYPELADDTDPHKGLVEPNPRMAYSDGYFAATGRIGVLTEVNAYEPLDRRVQVAYQTVLALLEQAHEHGKEWALATKAEQADMTRTGPGSKDIELDWKQGPVTETREVIFLGLTRRKSRVTGRVETVYEGDAPIPLKLPLYAMKASRWADAPPAAGGYVVAGGFAPVVRPILDAHNLYYREIGGDASFHRPDVKPKWFETDDVKFNCPKWPASLSDESNLEGHLRVEVFGTWKNNPSQDFLGRFHRGALFVPIAQPGAPVVMALFEPEGADSIVSWGITNSIWERHEYPERHKAVLLAEKALATYPELEGELVGLKDADQRLARVLSKAYPELFRRVGWIPVLKVAGMHMTTDK